LPAQELIISALKKIDPEAFAAALQANPYRGWGTYFVNALEYPEVAALNLLRAPDEAKRQKAFEAAKQAAHEAKRKAAEDARKEKQ